MIISKTNVLRNTVPVVTTGAGSGSASDPRSVVSPDHSTLYVGGNNTTLEFSFGAVTSVEYVGISGHNAGDTATGLGTISLLDGGTVLKTLNVDRNRAVVFLFNAGTGGQSFSDMRVRISSSTGNDAGLMRCAYIAAGRYLVVPNDGEQAGYKRNDLARPLKARTSVNGSAAPTAYILQRQPLTGTLTVPNVLRQFSLQEWQEFMDFAATEPFFINERIDRPQASYLCFDPNFAPPTAHPLTRELNNLSLTFKVFHGL